jgi:hypothetical protein
MGLIYLYLYFHINTFRSMCAIPSMVVFWYYLNFVLLLLLLPLPPPPPLPPPLPLPLPPPLPLPLPSSLCFGGVGGDSQTKKWSAATNVCIYSTAHCTDQIA